MSEYQYYAFISYNHNDSKTAIWLHRMLESYRLPSEKANELDANNKYLRPVFRDTDELNSGILYDELRLKLESSKYLIVICSEHSSSSEWVNDEVKTFINLGRYDHIIPVMLSDSTSVYPKALLDYAAENPKLELLGICVPQFGKDRTLVKVISKLIDVRFDVLWDRQRRKERNKSIAFLAACFLLIAVIFALYGLGAKIRSDEAQRNLATLNNEVRTGNLIPAARGLLELTEKRFSKEAAETQLCRIYDLMKYEGTIFPAYSISRDALCEDKVYDEAVAVSFDGNLVVLIDSASVRIVNVFSGSMDSFSPVSRKGMFSGPLADLYDNYGLEIHAVQFLPDSHILLILSSDGIIEYDCDKMAIFSEHIQLFGWKVKYGQSMLSRDYRPRLSVDSDGRYVAICWDTNYVEVLSVNGLEVQSSYQLEMVEDVSLVSIDGHLKLFAYNRLRSSVGNFEIDFLGDGVPSHHKVPSCKDFFYLPNGIMYVQEISGSWYLNGEYTMLEKPYPIYGTSSAIGKQRGYDAVIAYPAIDTTSSYPITILELSPEWIYGYNADKEVYRPVFSNVYSLHSNTDLNTVAVDGGQYVTIFRRVELNASEVDPDPINFFRKIFHEKI